MRRTLLAIVSVLVTGVVLGATSFGDQVVEKIPSFFVLNDEKHPVPVRELGDPGRSAFTFFKNTSIGSTDGSVFVSFTVPEGRRLVIETVSLNARLPAGQALVLGSVQTRVNGQFHLLHLAPALTGNLEGDPIYVVTQPMTLFADGGTEVLLTGTRNGAGSGIFNGSLAGHLIDCTVAACE